MSINFSGKALFSRSHFHFHLPLLLVDPLLHLGDHLLQQCVALFFRLCVDGMHFAFALGVGGRIAALEEAVVDLIDPASAGLAHLALVRGERRAYWRFFVLGGKAGRTASRGAQTPRCGRSRARSSAPPAAAWRR